MQLPTTAAALATVLLAACGGGGAGAGPAAPTTAAAPAVSTALADNAAAGGFDFATSRRAAGLRSTELVSDASRYADPARTYVSLWVPGAAQEQQLPASAKGVSFEVYDERDAASALSGEVAR